jgi:UDP-glucose 4-epimerase
VRYGNVLDSRGSIIPLFRWQAEHKRSFTVTHPDMTRFLMTLDESIDLITATAKGATSGEIWVPRLRSRRILDLAQIFATRFDRSIEFIGMRPGEKLHEALISEPESIRVTTDRDIFRLAPAHVTIATDAKIFGYQSSDDVLPKDDLAHYLEGLGIFARSLDDFVGRQIEEIATPAARRPSP